MPCLCSWSLFLKWLLSPLLARWTSLYPSRLNSVSLLLQNFFHIPGRIKNPLRISYKPLCPFPVTFVRWFILKFYRLSTRHTFSRYRGHLLTYLPHPPSFLNTPISGPGVWYVLVFLIQRIKVVMRHPKWYWDATGMPSALDQHANWTPPSSPFSVPVDIDYPYLFSHPRSVFQRLIPTWCPALHLLWANNIKQLIK